MEDSGEERFYSLRRSAGEGRRKRNGRRWRIPLEAEAQEEEEEELSSLPLSPL